MEKNHPLFSRLLRHCLLALLLVVAMAAVLFPFHGFLTRTVLALCFLLPVGWSAVRWGPAPGTCAALAAILAASLLLPTSGSTWVPDLLIPWSVLALILLLANGAYYWLRASLEQNPAGVYQEYCAPLARELHAELDQFRSTEGILYILANYFLVSFRARRVEVRIRPENSCTRVTVAEPEGDSNGSRTAPDWVLPISAVAGLAGEICLWREGSWLPPQDSYLFQFLMEQVTRSLDRVRSDWAETGRPAADREPELHPVHAASATELGPAAIIRVPSH